MRGIRASEATLSAVEFGGSGMRIERGRGEERGWRRATLPSLLPFRAPLLPYFPFSPSIRGGGERGRREDRNRVIETKSRGTFSDTHRIDGYAASRALYARPIRARFTSGERYRKLEGGRESEGERVCIDVALGRKRSFGISQFLSNAARRSNFRETKRDNVPRDTYAV